MSSSRSMDVESAPEPFEERELTAKQLCIQKCCLDPCACLCTGVSDLAAKLSVVASLAAAGAVALAVVNEAKLALLFAAISSTGATIAAVLAVCGSVVTGLVDKIMGEDNDSESSANDEESASMIRSKGESKSSLGAIPEDGEEKVEEGEGEGDGDLKKSDSKRVSFSE